MKFMTPSVYVTDYKVIKLGAATAELKILAVPEPYLYDGREVGNLAVVTAFPTDSWPRVRKGGQLPQIVQWLRLAHGYVVLVI